MTTPTTPAGWYPDPDGSGGLRYWDGSIWTEHRSPAAAAPDPVGESSTSEQATSVVSLPEQPTAVVPAGAHRAADQEPESGVPAASNETPSFEAPQHATPSFGPPSHEPPTFETPSFEATAAQATASASPSSEAPSSEPRSYETPPPAAPSYEPPSHEPPTSETPSYEGTSYEPTSYQAPSYEAPSFGAPSAFAGSDGTGGPPNNRKLITAYLSGVGVLLLALILAAVYGFVIRDNTPPQVTSSGSSTSSTTSSASSTTKTSSESPTTTPGSGAEATDGDFVFSVASTDSGDSITSPIDESVVKSASGEYFVVYVNVGNKGAAPVTWLSVLQQLSDGNQTFSPDVDASSALTGNQITINPGDQLQVALAFDVPVGTVPTSIQLHGLPGSAGVELPV